MFFITVKFLAEFVTEASNVDLCASCATQPYFNSQSEHGMDY